MTTFDPLLSAVIAWRDHCDQASAEEIVKELTPLLHRIARSYLSCPWLAEDAVQMAWMKLFRSLETFDAAVPFSAWAVLVLKNICSNLLRGLRRRPQVPMEELVGSETEFVDPVSLRTDLISAREILKRTWHTISLLPDQDRFIVNSLIFDELAAEEVARRTGLSAGAVRVRACRIRSQLRAAA